MPTPVVFASPNAAMINAAMAGPTMRAELNRAEFRPTALARYSRLTISEMNTWRAGLSATAKSPVVSARANTIQSWITPPSVSAASTPAVSAWPVWVTIISRRLSNRSASRPP